MELKKWIMDARVPLSLLLVQVIATGMQILSRVILSEGTFVFALVTYRHIIAALSIMPFALYFERGALRKINFEAFFWLFMVALAGIIMAMGLYYYGMNDTTATYAANFNNLVPIVTFVFAIVLRIEALAVHTKAGKIKGMGAMLCLAGALVMCLYKGKSFNLSHHNHHTIIIKSFRHKTRGTLFLIGSVISYGFWFVLQVKLHKVFPYKCSATLATCIVAAVQGAVIGVCIDRKPKSWQLGWNLQLITIVYSGALATAATFALISVAITEKGPTYPSMFNPLTLIFVMLIEAIFFAEDLYVGSLIGMVLIIAGLYSFLWGKNKDVKASPPPFKDLCGNGGGDVEETTVELGRLQSSVTIVPTSSLNVTSH